MGETPVARLPFIDCQPDQVLELVHQSCQMAPSPPSANTSTWPSGHTTVESSESAVPPKSWNAFHAPFVNQRCCVEPSAFGSKSSTVSWLDGGQTTAESPHEAVPFRSSALF